MKTLVYLNGEKFTNWDSVVINRSIDSICGSFSMVATYNYSEGESPYELSGLVEIFALKDGGVEPTSNSLPNLGFGALDEALLTDLDDSVKIMTGYIDIVDTSIGEGGLNVNISGRDITCDLIDCTIESKTLEWKDLKIYELYEEWLSPFGLTLSNKTDKASEKVVANPKPDQKVGDAMVEISKTEGFLIVTDEDGKIVLENKDQGSIPSPITLGINVLAASYKGDYTKRYSKVTVLDNSDQSPDVNNNIARMLTSGASNAVESDPVTDSSTKRYRPITVMGSGNLKEPGVTAEAKWRMAMSVASTFTLTVKLQGWLTNAKEVWKVNRDVYCSLRKLNIPSGRMLIKNITFESGSQGTYTNMDLVFPDAYDEFDGNGDSGEDDKTGDGNPEKLFRQLGFGG
jgi:prophage tail gpP-like protein